MILMKIYIDIPEGAQEFYPDEYLPSDMVKYSFNPEFMDLERFLKLVCDDLRNGVWTNERKKKGKNKKR